MRKHQIAKAYEQAPLIVNLVTQMEAGGAQNAAMQVCMALRERGWNSHVWFIYKKRPIDDRCGYVRWICERRPSSPSELYKVFVVLRDWMLEHRPIGVITYTHYANVIGQLVAWRSGIPHRLATQRNPSWSYPLGARILDMLWGTVGIYTGNVYVSKSVANSFRNYPRRYRVRSRVIPNGLRKPQPHLSKVLARQELGLPTDAVIVVNVGRLAYQKNQGMLIAAIAGIQDENIVLAIAGDGELRSELHDKVKSFNLENRVLLLGELPHWRIADLLVAGDIFAFPSRYEAFGFALVEAMMLGLPVVVSDIDAHREIVGDAGIFLPLTNPQAWSETIIELSRNEKLRQELGRRAKEQATLYDLDRMVDGYIESLFGADTGRTRDP